MNTRIHVSFKIKDPSAKAHTSHETDQWFTSTKEVDLPREPRKSEWMQDGDLSFNVSRVIPSISGPKWIIKCQSWDVSNWNDMCGVPDYPYDSDAMWHQKCEGLGWKMERSTP